MSLIPRRRGAAGTDADDAQPGTSGSARVTWAEVVLGAMTLGWPWTIRLCVIVLVAEIGWAGSHVLASWLGTLL